MEAADRRLSLRPRKWAIIVGISDYKDISDLELCDEDATDWFNHLSQRGFKCKVFGDCHMRNYPQYNGLATKTNVLHALRSTLASAAPQDTVCLTSAGHGSGDGKGNSYLCMWDGTSLWDYELAAVLATNPGCLKVVFLDNCFSGGIGPELQAVPNTLCLTTCSEDGYGYDKATHNNGAWTYAFLERTLRRSYRGREACWQDAFRMARMVYPRISGSRAKGDQPMLFDSTSGRVML